MLLLEVQMFMMQYEYFVWWVHYLELVCVALLFLP